MKKNKIRMPYPGLLIISLIPLLYAQAQNDVLTAITVKVDQPMHKIPPTLFGAFFEDINHSTDGGIYPELIRNRSFEDADTLQSWKFINVSGTNHGSVVHADVLSRPSEIPLNAFNRRSLKIELNGAFKLENYGYWGMNIQNGNAYTFKMAARCSGKFNDVLKVSLVDSVGKILVSSIVNNIESEWKYHIIHFTPSGSDPAAHLIIEGNGNGIIYLDMVSLMPDETWKDHGLRKDLAEAVSDLNPSFFRFPGGCWVEGDDLEHMYHWKNTIGDIDLRTPLWNIWEYNATNSLGYHEYLQMAEDLGAEPLFCINAGISHKEYVPMDQMGQWVQDALDAIEYANGSEETVWGSIRTKNGHPEPFNLRYIEIGNENGGDIYAERWKLMASAIRSKYPDITIIANDWGGYPTDPVPEIIDQHFYNVPDWFIWNANMYDSFDRNGPKVFVGEYAVTGHTGNGNLRGAIAEAAFMTGLEKNSDVVAMAAYAPLFCNIHHQRWPINLINFDSYRWYGLPSYYVQKMFAENQGTIALQVAVDNAPVIPDPYMNGCIGLGTWDNSAEFKDLKVTSPNGTVLFETDFTEDIDDWRKTGGEWSVHDGILRQSAIEPNTTAFVGDITWTDYIITLKARKLEGDNGIQIYFRNKDNGERVRWEIGGYGNTRAMMMNGITSEGVPGKIEAYRWYDIKVEVIGKRVKAYLDGKLIQDVTDNHADMEGLFVSAAKNEPTGEIILKVVNVMPETIQTRISLSGMKDLTGKGIATVLSSESHLDENTLDDPENVSPVSDDFEFSGSQIDRSFPGNSLTVFRLRTGSDHEE